MLSSSSQLDGLESIDEAREEEEDRNPGMPLGHEPQNGQLEERYGTVVRAAGCYQPSREAEHHVRADDVDGSDASQTLSRTQDVSDDVRARLALGKIGRAGKVGRNTHVSPAAVLHGRFMSAIIVEERSSQDPSSVCGQERHCC